MILCVLFGRGVVYSSKTMQFVSCHCIRGRVEKKKSTTDKRKRYIIVLAWKTALCHVVVSFCGRSVRVRYRNDTADVVETTNATNHHRQRRYDYVYYIVSADHLTQPSVHNKRVNKTNYTIIETMPDRTYII